MFERFTESARKVVVIAQDEARSLGHSYIGTEHLLIGLLREREGLAARVLNGMGVTTSTVRAMMQGPTGVQTTGQIPFTPRTKKVLELALREALSMGHNYVGTEHLLLALGRENEGWAALFLGELDADADKVRKEIIRLLSGPGRKDKPIVCPVCNSNLRLVQTEA